MWKLGSYRKLEKSNGVMNNLTLTIELVKI